MSFLTYGLSESISNALGFTGHSSDGIKSMAFLPSGAAV